MAVNEDSINTTNNRGRLLVKCPDKPGIVAALSKFLYDHDSNIIESSQYSSDPEGGTFFIRIEFHCEGLLAKRQVLEDDFKALASNFSWIIALHMPTKESERRSMFQRKFTA